MDMNFVGSSTIFLVLLFVVFKKSSQLNFHACVLCSVIQFCATAFAYYAQATAAQEIFGHTLQSLRGIKYLYK
jgi:hypothetical protein